MHIILQTNLLCFLFFTVLGGVLDVLGAVRGHENLASGLYPPRFPDRYNYGNIRARVPKAEEKTGQTLAHIVKAVATLERWLWACFNECRQVETISPESLDGYLGGFFKVLCKPSGEDYESLSLTKFRSYLSRFLKESGYPHCICTSPMFADSQKKFTARRKQLSLADKRVTSADNFYTT